MRMELVASKQRVMEAVVEVIEAGQPLSILGDVQGFL